MKPGRDLKFGFFALFPVIAAGYWIGSFKIGAFSLGPVTGALSPAYSLGSSHTCPFLA
jgi:putative transport protein